MEVAVSCRVFAGSWKVHVRCAEIIRRCVQCSVEVHQIFPFGIYVYCEVVCDSKIRHLYAISCQRSDLNEKE